MDHFAGLDVSVKQTSICIVDDTGRIVREVKVASEPEALLAVLKNPAYHFERIGLEAGPLSQWLFSALAEVELPVVCVETRHMAVLKAQINKTDRNDARGIAQMMRAGLYRPVGANRAKSVLVEFALGKFDQKAHAVFPCTRDRIPMASSGGFFSTLSLEFRLVAWYRGRPCGGNHSALTRSAYVQWFSQSPCDGCAPASLLSNHDGLFHQYWLGRIARRRYQCMTRKAQLS
jgi:hypothetical protein